MSSAEHFPLFFPGDARRAFGSEQICRRIARSAHWDGGSRILELSAGSAGILLAREFGCSIAAVDADDRSLDALRERVKAHVLADRVVVKTADLNQLPYGDGEFDGILALGRVPIPLSVAVRVLRRHLAPKGRLVLTYPFKVGRNPLKVALAFWERKIGEPLLLPREALELLEKAGFEPEGVETLDDSELDDYYRDLEPLLPRQPPALEKHVVALKEEIDLHRSQGGKASVTLGLIVGRRKEPGEKPPPSRDSG